MPRCFAHGSKDGLRDAKKPKNLEYPQGCVSGPDYFARTRLFSPPLFKKQGVAWVARWWVCEDKARKQGEPRRAVCK